MPFQQNTKAQCISVDSSPPPPYEGETFFCEKCLEKYDINSKVTIKKLEYCKPCVFNNNLTF